jgi:quinol monooxygenase YgiN
MYGLIVKLTSAPGRRAELIEMMGGNDSNTVQGCLSYIVAEDDVDYNVLWITEVWSSQAAHEASLQSPPITQSLTKADMLITSFEKVATTKPVKSSSHPLHGEV